jgi:UDP-glucuronate 4-epimerase
MKLDSRRILLTGGAGFIGSHLAEALLAEGAKLTIVDCLDDFYSPQRKQANLRCVRAAGDHDFCQVDICDAALRGVFERAKPDIVIHLAARAGVRPSIEQPLLYERVNGQGTVRLLELSREFKVGRFIFGSSSSVYGATNRLPFTEDDPTLHPISPYAATKLAGELMCYTYAHLYGLPIVCLRFFTVYGPRQRPDLAIHKFTALMEAGQAIPVFGDGSTGRDYTYVEDIVAGVRAALDYALPPDQAPFEVFNLGNSAPVTLNELIANLETATGRRASRSELPAQPGDVPLTWASIEKAGRLLRYRPATPLQRGLAKFVAWYRENRS